MAGPPSLASQLRLLGILQNSGMVIAGPDQRVLRYLELRRYVRALPLYDPRNGKPTMARAWAITPAGTAASLRLAQPTARRKSRPTDEVRQIDLEEAIASARSGRAPECAPLTEPDAPAVPAAGVSAPQGRSSNPALAAAKPEHAHV